eukprot:s4384_g1.t1
MAAGTAGPYLPAPDRSGHCRTSSASSTSQWALPDFKCELQIPVGTAGLQPRAPDSSGHCRASTASPRSQWALPDFDREPQIPVRTAGLRPRGPDRSGHCRTSTCAKSASSSGFRPSMEREARVALPGGRLERLPELLGGLYRPDHIEACCENVAVQFGELHLELFAKDPEVHHVVQNFSNPYDIRPNFKNYPHSNLLPEFFTEILELRLQRCPPNPRGIPVFQNNEDILHMEGMPRFIVEVGSLHGHSAIQMATVLDKLQMTEVPILCIDPFTGDTNMWASYQQDQSVGGWVNIIDGRMTVFDQFMANVQFAVNRSVSKHHILPFQATSTVGARWLVQKGFAPDLIFLDSAHELDETYLELSLYFNLLEPGGILFGDDYGWPAVKKDVDRFVEQHNLQFGYENPIDLRIARAQAGATNLIWIMRKAKLAKIAG